MNTASPTAAGAKLARPARPRAGRSWQLRSRRPTAIWHDVVRGLPRGVTHGTWRIPVLVDGHRTDLQGTIERVGAPAAWPWLVVGAAFAGALALVPGRRTLIRPATVWLGSLGAAAALLSATGFANRFDRVPGRLDRGRERSRRHLRGGSVPGPGVEQRPGARRRILGSRLAIGLTKLPVFLHGIVLSALPGELRPAGGRNRDRRGSRSGRSWGSSSLFDVLEHYEEPELLTADLERPGDDRHRAVELRAAVEHEMRRGGHLQLQRLVVALVDPGREPGRY